MKKFLLGLALTALTSASSFGALIVYKLDFGAPGQVLANGFTAANASGFNVANDAPVIDLGGGVTISFTNINNYSLGSATNPLITDGWFVSSGNTANFTISGLNAGDSVTLHAIGAWNASDVTADRSAWVSLNGSALVNSWNPSLYAAPNTTPTLSDMTLIASNQIVGAGGSISGYFSNTDGVTTVPEGQVGAFWIQVNTVPEPGAGLGLLLAGAFGTLLRRRRRR